MTPPKGSDPVTSLAYRRIMTALPRPVASAIATEEWTFRGLLADEIDRILPNKPLSGV